MNFEIWWNDYDNVQCDKDACEDAFYSGQQSRQKEIDELHKRIKLALCALESTPYWDRSGNCEPAISILKKTSE